MAHSFCVYRATVDIGVIPMLSPIYRATCGAGGGRELKKRAKNNELKNLPKDRLYNLTLSLKERLEKDTNRKLISVPSDPGKKLLRELNEVYIEFE